MTELLARWTEKLAGEIRLVEHAIRKDEPKRVVPTVLSKERETEGKRETFLTYLEEMTHRTPVELISLTRD